MGHHWRKPIRKPASEAKVSPVAEVVELFLGLFRPAGTVKNEWLMPFEPGPSSLKRNKPQA